MHPLIYIPRRRILTPAECRGGYPTPRGADGIGCGMGLGTAFGGSRWTPARILGSLGAWCDFTSDSRGTYAAQPDQTDLDMEQTGVASWPVVLATVAKSTTIYRSGTQSLAISTTGLDRGAYRANGTVALGRRVRISGWVRSDGTSIPVVRMLSAGDQFTGTTSTDWQYFEIECTADSLNRPWFVNGTASSSTFYVDGVAFETLSSTRFDPRAARGALAGSALVQAADAAMPWYDSGVTTEAGTARRLSSDAANTWNWLHSGDGALLIQVFANTDVTQTAGICGTALLNSQVGAALVNIGSAVYLRVCNGGAGYAFNSGAPYANGTHIVAAYVKSGANQTLLRLDGAASVTGTLSSPASAATNATFDMSVNNIGAYTYSLPGTTGELFACQGEFTLSQIQHVERYFASKHGIVLP